MIVEYHRPASLEEALVILKRQDLPQHILGGGTYLSQQTDPLGFGVIDIQSLGFGNIEYEGKSVSVGGKVALQQLVSDPMISSEIKKAISLEGTQNIRQMATLPGTLRTCKSNSPLAVVLLAIDAQLHLEPGSEKVSLGEWILNREQYSGKSLITKISWSLSTSVAMEFVNKTPVDQPILCVCVSRWKSERYRACIGDIGRDSPQVVFDGIGSEGIEDSIINACSHYPNNDLTNNYIKNTYPIITQRCLSSLTGKK